MLPSGILLAGIACTFVWLPDIGLLLPDDAMQGPRVNGMLSILLLLPLLAGLLATLQLRRILAWPWLWLAAILLLHWRPELDLTSQILSLAAEFSLLLIFSIAETMLYVWREHWSTLPRRLALPLAGLLLWIAGSLSLTPDNPAWQGLLGLIAAMCLLGTALLEELSPRLAVARPGWLYGLAESLLQTWRKLRALRMRLRRRQPAASRPLPDTGPPDRPMLRLEEGYLVSHAAEASADQRRRRIG